MLPPRLRKRLYSWHPTRARRWRRLPGLERLSGSDLALTFDDGPGPDATPAILSQLDQLGVRATFFLLGQEVIREPEIARKIAAAGHEIGLHGHSHLRLDKVSPRTALRDLRDGLHATIEVTGQRPRWFRPPYGRLSEASLALALALDLRVAYWSSWGLDWEEATAAQIEAEVCSGLDAGAIVLLHDTPKFGRRTSATSTALALQAIVERGRSQHLSWKKLSEAAM